MVSVTTTSLILAPVPFIISLLSTNSLGVVILILFNPLIILWANNWVPPRVISIDIALSDVNCTVYWVFAYR